MIEDPPPRDAQAMPGEGEELINLVDFQMGVVSIEHTGATRGQHANIATES
jgi:hypothetical protein